mmetsp:Transcript_3710/g.11533  ORF Transcript_3710/g.11533 Transcript_3710/m.11533 type:complete len:229 (-) Transcript_3710:162-848(-)
MDRTLARTTRARPSSTIRASGGRAARRPRCTTLTRCTPCQDANAARIPSPRPRPKSRPTPRSRRRPHARRSACSRSRRPHPRRRLRPLRQLSPSRLSLRRLNPSRPCCPPAWPDASMQGASKTTQLRQTRLPRAPTTRWHPCSMTAPRSGRAARRPHGILTNSCASPAARRARTSPWSPDEHCAPSVIPVVRPCIAEARARSPRWWSARRARRRAAPRARSARAPARG